MVGYFDFLFRNSKMKSRQKIPMSSSAADSSDPGAGIFVPRHEEQLQDRREEGQGVLHVSLEAAH
jgi:hypothetical protein